MHTLLFIYNANSGTINTLFDIGHKLFSPKTYTCNLCMLTHGTFSENKIWKAFKINSNLDIKFYHIDEFLKLYPNTNYTYPIILKKEHVNLEVILNTSEINKISSAEELINLLKDTIT
ncbi:GTPase [Flavobacteriaceae bacterium AU392]|nr:GTPase [Flavobacteriaceae bacterium]RKM81674.1 GTPase [Flavobacteriaceae bacterium AU392]